MRTIGMEPPTFTLGVVRADSLATKSSPVSSLDVAPEHRADAAELVAHNIYDLLLVEPEKHGKYRELKLDETFDLVMGNPPYVAEANNRPLFEHLRSIPAWRSVYRGKTDYLYTSCFLRSRSSGAVGGCALSCRPHWMNAGTADFLRERLATELTLEELYLFGSYKLFAVDQGRHRRLMSRARSSSRRRRRRRRGTSCALSRSRRSVSLRRRGAASCSRR